MKNFDAISYGGFFLLKLWVLQIIAIPKVLLKDTANKPNSILRFKGIGIGHVYIGVLKAGFVGEDNGSDTEA